MGGKRKVGESEGNSREQRRKERNSTTQCSRAYGGKRPSREGKKTAANLAKPFLPSRREDSIQGNVSIPAYSDAKGKIKRVPSLLKRRKKNELRTNSFQNKSPDRRQEGKRNRGTYLHRGGDIRKRANLCIKKRKKDVSLVVQT